MGVVFRIWYDGRYYASSPTDNPTGPITGLYRVDGRLLTQPGRELRPFGDTGIGRNELQGVGDFWAFASPDSVATRRIAQRNVHLLVIELLARSHEVGR